MYTYNVHESKAFVLTVRTFVAMGRWCIYYLLWAVVSGIDTDAQRLKEIVKNIKNKLAVAGTIKGKNIEILFGRTDKTRQLTDILVKEGFDRDSIHSANE